jgi:TonB-linked SusC/RagA family outer membrane protein
MCLSYTPQLFAAPHPDIQTVQQATKKISGTVTDADGPVIGATVREVGKSNGAITDLDGHFTLSVRPGSKIEISYVGYKTQVISVGDQTTYSVTLASDSKILEDVVVVGYGVQKKKLVTGATVEVKGDDVSRLNTVSVLGALQSQTPGVNIVASSGQPGEGYKVNIRGLGTVGDSAPLYVIDGVAGADINALNPADIESIDVLKDAASAAIYGSRAANGVILVTTKQGKSGKIQVSYDGYLGWQNLYKNPDLLNAQETMALADEALFNSGSALTDWSGRLGERTWGMLQNGWTGTNWFEEMRKKNAITTNHALNVTGGTDISNFSAGLSYTKQDGILGKPRIPQYQRYTARLNSSEIILKNMNRDIIRIGENLTFFYSTKKGIYIDTTEASDIYNALSTSPLLPLYNKDGGYMTQNDKQSEGWIYDANAGSPILQILDSHGNNMLRHYGLNATAYMDVEPIKGLKYHGSFSYRMHSYSYRSLTVPYAASANKMSDSYTVDQQSQQGHSIAVENTLTYKVPTFHKVSMDFLLGQSFEKTVVGDNLEGGNSVPDGQQLPTLNSDMSHAWLNNANNVLSSVILKGYPDADWALASFFGRANFNYDEKYLATLILRTDGSSNFARGHRWGWFPSASAGWVMSSEKWMDSTRSWLDFMKIRVSWGQNGNQNITNFQYVSPIAFDQTHVYNFGNTVLNTSGTKSTGAYATTIANPDVTWETSDQFDAGVDMRFLHTRLGLTFDYYVKTTKDWLVQAPILDTAGAGAPYINGGDVRNSGFEVALNWNDRIHKDFQYGVNFNLSYNKNKVTRIANNEGVIHGEDRPLGTVILMNEIYRAQVGEPIGYFWGYKTAGVFQNQEEINKWRAAGNGFAQSDPQPGDLKYVDLNHDGVINDNDKTNIGDPHPDFRLGFGFNIAYRGLDFSVTTQGAFGNKIFFAYRSYTTKALERWHGEGTSDRFPRLGTGAVMTTDLSDINLEKGDYLKIQNITLGYDFKRLLPKVPLQQLRLYVQAQNLYTFTGYPGMDPEVGFGGDTDHAWVSGIDIGSYPSPRTFLVGLSIKY